MAEENKSPKEGLRDSLINRMQGSSQPEQKQETKEQGSGSSDREMVGNVSREKPGWWDKLTKYEVVKARDLVSFTEKLSLLLEVGVPMVRALRLTAKGPAKSPMHQVAVALEEDVQKGNSLAEAMAKHPGVFSHYYVKSVQAGEEAGRIVTSLKILTSYLEREDRLLSRIRTAALYPSITAFLAIALAGFLFVYVVPAFAQVYNEYELELPFVTTVIYQASLFFQKFLWLITLVAVVLGGLLVAQFRYNLVEDLWSRIMLHLPVTKGLMEKITIYRFAKVMSMLLKSGLPLLTSVKLAAEIMPIANYRKAIGNVATDLEGGKPLSQSMTDRHLFDDVIADMVAVGEEVGALERVFERIAANMEGDVDNIFNSLTDIIEPLLTLFVGLMVMVIALALFLPYFSLGGLFSA